jgi:hypothetical protein
METNNIQPRADLADSADVVQETTKSLLEHARVKNIVSDGVFIKAYSVPQGVKLYTKQFATDHVTILAQGNVYIEGPDYKAKLTAPVHVLLKADTRYAVATLDDCVWYCIHPTTETDLDAIIKTF